MNERKLPSLDLKRNYARIKDEIKEAVDSVLESQYFIMGPEVKAFENEVASYMETGNAIGCASGTDALILALMALDLEDGDEVITTPYSFFATASCITRVGAKPVFVDVDPQTYTIDPSQMMEKVSEKTKAVLPVHLFGQMVPLEDYMAELASRDIAVIEDAAQAFGSWRRVENRIIRAGSWGKAGCYSFFPTKNLGAFGDGGMIVSDDDAMAQRISRLRVHGAGTTYFHDEVGLNSRLDAIQAAVLRVKLRHLDEWTEERRLVADRYNTLFGEYGLLDVITPPVELDGNYHIFHQYVPKAEKRDELQAFLATKGITTRVYYPLSLHQQNCFEYLGYKQGDFPVSEELASSTIALPVFPELAAEEQEWVVSSIADFYGRKKS